MAEAALRQSTADAARHLHSVCEISLNRPPLRAKVDRQSFDELKPGVDSAIALLDWFAGLQQSFAGLVRELAAPSAAPSPAALTLIVEALDACIVLENQFSGWSACINRFSWFKRTFQQIQRDVAVDCDVEKLQRDIGRFHGFISAPPARVCSRRAVFFYCRCFFLSGPACILGLASQAIRRSRSACT